MPMIEIRRLKGSELPQVYRLMHKVLPKMEHYPKKPLKEFLKYYTLKQLTELRRKGGAVFLGAFDGKRLVGFTFGWNDYGVFWTEWTCVEEHHRRHHIALGFKKMLEREARKLGCHKMHSATLLKNRALIGLDKKAGYFVEGTLRNHWYGLDYVLLSKNIKKGKR